MFLVIFIYTLPRFKTISVQSVKVTKFIVESFEISHLNLNKY